MTSSERFGPRLSSPAISQLRGDRRQRVGAPVSSGSLALTASVVVAVGVAVLAIVLGTTTRLPVRRPTTGVQDQSLPAHRSSGSGLSREDGSSADPSQPPEKPTSRWSSGPRCIIRSSMR
jgi:hypothetical protein